MDLTARTQYLQHIKNVKVSCQSKLETLLNSIGWSMEALHKKPSKDSSPSPDVTLHSECSESTTLEGPCQTLDDFEKRYNDLISGLPNPQKKDTLKSEAEVLAELLEFERNAKRRRISYKNKVHTKNKSHTEVLRELVREQMEVLKEISGDDIKEEKVAEKHVENEERRTGLIQLRFFKGNPHTMWRKIGQLVENREIVSTREFRGDDRTSGSRSRQHSKERWRHYSRNDKSAWRRHSDRDDNHRNSGKKEKSRDREKHQPRSSSSYRHKGDEKRSDESHRRR